MVKKNIIIIAYNLRYGGGKLLCTFIINYILKCYSDYSIDIIVSNNFNNEELEAFDSNYNLVKIATKKNYFSSFILHTITLPKILSSKDYKIIFNLGNFPVPYKKSKQIVLLQNAFLSTSYFNFRKYVSIKNSILILLQQLYFRFTIKYASLLVCQTDIVKNNLICKYNIRCETVILPNSVGLFDRSIYKIDKLFDSYIYDVVKNKRVFLYAASFYTHKNISLIIDLVFKYKKDLENCIFILTLDVKNSQGARKIIKEIDDKNLNSHIINLGTLSQTKLYSLYLKTYAVIIPSFLESFSSAYTEAFHFKIPILTSNLDFSHHICSNSALYFDPFSSEEMFNKIKLLKIQRTYLQHNSFKRLYYFRNNFNKNIKNLKFVVDSFLNN